MGELVEAVLAHARVGTTAISSAAHTHCEDALSVAIDNLRKDIELSGAQIQYRSLPLVEVNPQALSQLFQNLISNAIKYRRQGVTPEITIGAEWKSRMWTISVSDNGLGLEPEWFTRIFQPMQRRHGLDVAGSGIGLATCRKIVMRVGGSIWIESQVGVGSTFYCTLPGPGPDEEKDSDPLAAALDIAESESEASR
jgi:light-regulated signal transduction histidine kinase (bacteriophytochrome)